MTQEELDRINQEYLSQDSAIDGAPSGGVAGIAGKLKPIAAPAIKAGSYLLNAIEPLSRPFSVPIEAYRVLLDPTNKPIYENLKTGERVQGGSRGALFSFVQNGFGKQRSAAGLNPFGWKEIDYAAEGIDKPSMMKDLWRREKQVLKGEIHPDFTTLLIDAGADPDSKATLAAGLALDIFPGFIIDPLSAVSAGYNAVGRLKKAAGMLGKPGVASARVAAAMENEWGLINVCGTPLLPKALNVPAAEVVDKISSGITNSETYKFARKAVGGYRYLAKEAGLDELMDLQAGLSADRREKLTEVGRRLHPLLSASDTELALVTYAIEHPEILNPSDIPALVKKAKSGNAHQEFYEAVGAFVSQAAKTVNAHRASFLEQIDGLRGSLGKMDEFTQSVDSVSANDLLPTFRKESNKPNATVDDMLASMQNRDKNNPFSPDAIITKHLANNGELVPGQSAQFRSIFSDLEWSQLSREAREQGAEVSVEKAALEKQAGLSEKGALFSAPDVSEAPEGARFLFMRPPVSSLPSDLAKVAKAKQQEINSLLDSLKSFAESGGNTLGLTDASVDASLEGAKRYKKYLREFSSATGQNIPNTALTKTVIQAIHHRTVGAQFPAGFYKDAHNELAELMIAEHATTPAARHVATMDWLHKRKAEILVRMEAIRNGSYRVGSEVPQDVAVSVSSAPGQQARTELLRKAGQYEDEAEIIAQNIGMAQDPDRAVAMREQRDLLRAEAQRIRETAGGGEPIEYAQAELRKQLDAELADVQRQIDNPNQFEKHSYIMRSLQDRISRLHNVTEYERMNPNIRMTPQVREIYNVIHGVMKDTMKEVEEILKPLGGKTPFGETYMPHVAEGRSIFYDFLRAGKDKKARKAYAEERMAHYESLGVSDTGSVESMVREDVQRKFGPAEFRGAGRGTSPYFEHRKYPYTIYEINAADLPVKFSTDAVSLASMNAKTWQDWIYGYKLHKYVIEAKDSRGFRIARNDFANATEARKAGYVPVQYEVPFIDPQNNPFNNWYIKKETDRVLQGMTGTHRVINSNPVTKAIYNVTSDMLRYWSARTLVLFPAFHIRNFVGDNIRAFYEGLTPGDPVSYYRSHRIAMEIMANRMKFPDMEIFGEHAGKVVFGKMKEVEKMLGGLREKFPGCEHFETPEKFLKLLSRENVIQYGFERDISLPRNVVPSKKRGVVASVAHEMLTQQKSVEAGGIVGEAVNDYTRVALFTKKLHEFAELPGVTAKQAIAGANASVRKALFDYRDLTPTERFLKDLVFPFYTYYAKSIPYQISTYLHEPKFASVYGRLYFGSYNGFLGEVRPEDGPEYLAKSGMVPVRKEKKIDDKGNRHDVYTYFSPNGWVPISDINELANSFRWLFDRFSRREPLYNPDENDTAKYVFGAMSPFISETIQQMFNHDIRTGKAISDGQTADIFGFNVPPSIAHIVRNIRLVTELDRLNPGGVFTKIHRSLGYSVDVEGREGMRPHRNEPNEFYRWTRFLTGVGYQEIDLQDADERKLVYGNTLSYQYRARVRAALRQGNTAEADLFTNKLVMLGEDVEDLVSEKEEIEKVRMENENWKNRVNAARDLLKRQKAEGTKK